MPSPLFPNAAREARQQYQQSAFGRLYTEITSLGTGRAKGSLRDILRRYGARIRPKDVAAEAGQMGMQQLLHEVQRYRKQGGLSKRVLDDFLDALGPAGNLIRAIAGTGATKPSKALERELQAATKFLEAFGRRIFDFSTVKSANRSLSDMIDELEQRGYQVISPEEQKPKSRLPFGISETTRSGAQRKVVDLPDLQGKIRLPVDHPVVTGKFVKVDSTNVYSIAYDAERAALLVYFKAQGEHGEKLEAAGSLYQYSDIPPRSAKAFLDAPSKGKWVWDNLRIRGTVSGHRKPYRLVGVTRGYVPRQATYLGNGEEWFIPRQLHVGGGKWLLSSRPAERATVMRGEPNTGAPRRPRDGRPRS